MLPSRIPYPNSFALLPHSDSSKMLLTRQTVCLLQVQKDSPVFPDSWHSSCRLLQQSFGKPKTRDLSSLRPARDGHDTGRMPECVPAGLGADSSRANQSHRINKLSPFVSYALIDRPISPICQGGFTKSTAQSGLFPINHSLNIFSLFLASSTTGQYSTITLLLTLKKRNFAFLRSHTASHDTERSTCAILVAHRHFRLWLEEFCDSVSCLPHPKLWENIRSPWTGRLGDVLFIARSHPNARWTPSAHALLPVLPQAKLDPASPTRHHAFPARKKALRTPHPAPPRHGAFLLLGYRRARPQAQHRQRMLYPQRHTHNHPRPRTSAWQRRHLSLRQSNTVQRIRYSKRRSAPNQTFQNLLGFTSKLRAAPKRNLRSQSISLAHFLLENIEHASGWTHGAWASPSCSISGSEFCYSAHFGHAYLTRKTAPSAL